MGHRKIDQKSNEITAIPELLAMLELEGCVVTIDTMGAQTEKAKKIVKKEADYVRALNGNQSTLKDDVRMGEMIRAHWSLENSLHWVLDITVRE